MNVLQLLTCHCAVVQIQTFYTLLYSASSSEEFVWVEHLHRAMAVPLSDHLPRQQRLKNVNYNEASMLGVQKSAKYELSQLQSELIRNTR